MLNLNPLTQKKIKRFKEIKRGYWSFIILSILLVLSLFAELLINSKALVVKYNGSYSFPVISDVRLGNEFGQAQPVKRITVCCRKRLRPKVVTTL
ncbi:oligopeptide transport system permease protein OppC [Photobacterium aphoticum]|uniref:Oligopeptide transport system permease protein OppC n=1 Tax=Photobacterium aphoticum TaxID=754436 RepID=A0A090QXI4_9GAMM|nr:oligopeptide transport system permease protein OppC [Photobacterium aphoticum]